MTEMTFERARVGDEVESLLDGRGKIIAITPDYDYPIRVLFTGCEATYTFCGRHGKDYIRPDLYWPGVQVIPAPPPERMVKKTVAGIVVYYISSGKIFNYYNTRADAEAVMRRTGRLGLYEFFHTYEVEDSDE